MNYDQLLIQSGALGLCLVMALLDYKKTTNHYKHYEDAAKEQAIASKAHSEVLDRNTAAWAKTAEVLERLERKLDI